MDEEVTPSECCRRSFAESLKDTATRLLKDPRPAPESVSQFRMELCEECEHFRANSKMCKICGCYLPLKTQMANMKCPLDKWTEWTSGN